MKDALESLLGRPLADDERVSVHAYQTHEAPIGEQEKLVAQTLREYFKKVDGNLSSVPEKEMDDVIDEALRNARPGYQPLP